MKKITALIDGSIYSQSVCEHAAWVAGRMGSALELIHVLGRRESANGPSNLSGAIALGARTSILEELSELDAQRAKLAQKRGRAILDDALGMAHLAGADAATAKLRQGDLVEAVEDLEKDADLFVIGKRGEGADFAKMHLGSNLERVVRSTAKPVLVTSRAFKPIERALVAFDGGPSSLKAVDAMARSPLFAGLSVKLITVGQEKGQALEKARATLSAGSIEAEIEHATGEPEKVIAERVEAEGINLLVMGAYGHSRIRSLIIGSTTEATLRACLIPVLLYR